MKLAMLLLVLLAAGIAFAQDLPLDFAGLRGALGFQQGVWLKSAAAQSRKVYNSFVTTTATQGASASREERRVLHVRPACDYSWSGRNYSCCNARISVGTARRAAFAATRPEASALPPVLACGPSPASSAAVTALCHPPLADQPLLQAFQTRLQLSIHAICNTMLQFGGSAVAALSAASVRIAAPAWQQLLRRQRKPLLAISPSSPAPMEPAGHQQPQRNPGAVIVPTDYDRTHAADVLHGAAYDPAGHKAPAEGDLAHETPPDLGQAPVSIPEPVLPRDGRSALSEAVEPVASFDGAASDLNSTCTDGHSAMVQAVGAEDAAVIDALADFLAPAGTHDVGGTPNFGQFQFPGASTTQEAAASADGAVRQECLTALSATDTQQPWVGAAMEASLDQDLPEGNAVLQQAIFSDIPPGGAEAQVAEAQVLVTAPAAAEQGPGIMAAQRGEDLPSDTAATLAEATPEEEDVPTVIAGTIALCEAAVGGKLPETLQMESSGDRPSAAAPQRALLRQLSSAQSLGSGGGATQMPAHGASLPGAARSAAADWSYQRDAPMWQLDLAIAVAEASYNYTSEATSAPELSDTSAEGPASQADAADEPGGAHSGEQPTKMDDGAIAQLAATASQAAAATPVEADQTQLAVQGTATCPAGASAEEAASAASGCKAEARLPAPQGQRWLLAQLSLRTSPVLAMTAGALVVAALQVLAVHVARRQSLRLREVLEGERQGHTRALEQLQSEHETLVSELLGINNGLRDQLKEALADSERQRAVRRTAVHTATQAVRAHTMAAVQLAQRVSDLQRSQVELAGVLAAALQQWHDRGRQVAVALRRCRRGAQRLARERAAERVEMEQRLRLQAEERDHAAAAAEERHSRELAELRQRLEEDLAAEQRRHAATTRTARAHSAHSDAAIRRLQRQQCSNLTAWLALRSWLGLQVEMLSDRAETLAAEHSSFLAEARRQVEQHRLRVVTVQQQLAEQVAVVVETNRTNGELVQLLEDKNAAILELEGELAATSAVLESQRQQRDDLQRTLTATEESRATSQREVEELEARLREAQVAAQTSQARAARLATANELLEQQVSQFVNTINMLAEMEEAHLAPTRAHAAALERQMVAEREALAAALAERDAKLAGAAAELAEARREAESALQARGEVAKRLEEVERELRAVQSELFRLEEEGTETGAVAFASKQSPLRDQHSHRDHRDRDHRDHRDQEAVLQQLLGPLAAMSLPLPADAKTVLTAVSPATAAASAGLSPLADRGASGSSGSGARGGALSFGAAGGLRK